MSCISGRPRPVWENPPMGFSRQEYWSGEPLPRNGIKYFSGGNLEKWYLKVKVWIAQSCPTLCDPMDYTVHGILQARILEWVAFPFSRGSSQPRDWNHVSHIAGEFFTSWATNSKKQINQFKNCKRLESTLFKRIQTNGQQIYENILNIINH